MIKERVSFVRIFELFDTANSHDIKLHEQAELIQKMRQRLEQMKMLAKRKDETIVKLRTLNEQLRHNTQINS